MAYPSLTAAAAEGKSLTQSYLVSLSIDRRVTRHEEDQGLDFDLCSSTATFSHFQTAMHVLSDSTPYHAPLPPPSPPVNLSFPLPSSCSSCMATDTPISIMTKEGWQWRRGEESLWWFIQKHHVIIDYFSSHLRGPDSLH